MSIERSIKQYRLGFQLVDVVAVGLAFWTAHALRHESFTRIPAAYIYALPYTLLIFTIAFRFAGVYETLRGGLREIFKLSLGVAAGMAVILSLSFFYRGFSYSRLAALYFATLAVLVPLHFRFIYRAVLDLLFGRSRWLKRVLVVGDSPTMNALLAEMDESKSDFTVLGVLSVSEDTGEIVGPHHVRVLGDYTDPEQYLDRLRPDMVIIADPNVPAADQQRIVESCLDRNIHWKLVPKISAPPDQDIGLAVVGGLPLLGSKGNNITGFNYVLKRMVDSLIAGSLLLVFSPLMLGVAALIKLLSRGPVFFKQERIGYRGRPFLFYKFRSMHVSNSDAIHRDYVKKWIEGNGDELDDGKVKVHKITKDPRVIPFIGALIRKFSIDELPQLLNVIKGDMSLVGPRPCLPYEVELYRRWHKMRFDVLPGITGLWQVSGRNRLTFDQMVALDIRYLQNWSLTLDLTIMARTPYVVLFDKAY